ncbi:MAG: D-alanine--D-alanine ligase, partial [Vicinamibacteria bacterium]|nr:D-alanine--D-alanine ligase [Vicinamibacteria bacterium]
MSERMKIALLFGGRSGEHEVSLKSAASVAQVLAESHRVLPVFIAHDGDWWLQTQGFGEMTGAERVVLAPTPTERGCLRQLENGQVLARPDLFFPLLHGTYGEDGTVQGLLELAGTPYVGSGVAASAASMDKAFMKALIGHAGLPQVKYAVLKDTHARDERQGALDSLGGWPVFVKPANLGSSVGISKAHTPQEFESALDFAFQFDHKILIEAGVQAREIEVAMLGNEQPEASIAGEIVPDREFYDYDSKYSATSQT